MNRPPVVASDAAGIARAADCLRSGGLVVYPTETLYGLGVSPLEPALVGRLLAVKGRDAAKGLLCLIRGEDDLTLLAASVPDDARLMMQAFWPGPLTLVLPGRGGLPPDLRGPGGTVALRQSDSPICQSLLSGLGGPLTSTSANRSGLPAVRCAAEAAACFGADVDLILDGGFLPDERPSTVVDVSGGPVRVLREGRISRASIERVLGQAL